MKARRGSRRPEPSPLRARNTYKTAAAAQIDKAQLQALIKALDCAARTLRLDECGAWHIIGRHGHIHTWGDGMRWLIYCRRPTPVSWTYAKRRLHFCEVTQNGDDEGCLRLDHVPSPEEAAAIRKAVGIPKRPNFSPEELAKRGGRIKRAA